MKNVCIVGYGAIGPLHAEALDETQNAQLYAVCDINPERIRLCQEKYEVKGYQYFAEMLTDQNIDSVHICTPHYLHFEMIMAALKAGKSVVVEKPVTMTKEQFDILLHTKGSDKICLVFQNRLNPCARMLKSIAKEQTLGQAICAKGIITWLRTREYYLSDSWRGKWATEGGGLMINQAVHTLDMLIYVMGDIQSLRATMANYSLTDTIEVEDTASAYFQFANGATGIFFATNAYKENDMPDIEVVFERGKARYVDNTLYIDNKPVCTDVAATGEKAYWGKGHVTLFQEYYDQGRYFTISDAKNTMYALFGMYESAREGSKEVFISEN